MSGEIYTLIPKVSKAIGAIGKDRRNQQQGFQFRSIDQIYDAAHGPLSEHGVSVSTKVHHIKQEERETSNGKHLYVIRLLMDVTFSAPDGSSVTTTTVGEASDMADKAANKAMSAAMKYAFIQTFCIPLVEHDDADATTPEPTTRVSRSIQYRIGKAVLALRDAKTKSDVTAVTSRLGPLKAECTVDQLAALNEAIQQAEART